MQKIIQALKNAGLSIVSTLKKSFTLAGRANRCEFWTFQVAMLLLLIVEFVLFLLAAGSVLGTIFFWLFLIIDVLLLIPNIAVLVRRLHDVNLSGFWFWYLSPVGIGMIYIVYLLGLDKSAERFVERINKSGSPWLGWILAIISWWWAASSALLLICLYKGTDGENEFGPEATCPCCCEKK